MKILYKYLLIILAIILEATFSKFITIFGVKPDIVLILIICFALLNGSTEGIILSLFGGLLQDILYNNAIGVETLALLIVCYIAGVLSTNVFRDNTFVAFVFVLIGTLLYNLIIIFSMILMKYDINFIKGFLDIVLIQAIYNSIITIFIFRYIVKLNNYIKDTKIFFFDI
ncbi:MAG: rod shape-determining protein MreD [Thermoanaerobacteraceae bacterium]|jgi:rod shape-determining protein MreD|nr:rod shape-determining protein MreD [Thermoanaerobacteraceae bacterium]